MIDWISLYIAARFAELRSARALWTSCVARALLQYVLNAFAPPFGSTANVVTSSGSMMSFVQYRCPICEWPPSSLAYAVSSSYVRMSTLMPSFASCDLITIAVALPATSFETSIRNVLKPCGYFDFARYAFALSRLYGYGFRLLFQNSILYGMYDEPLVAWPEYASFTIALRSMP